MSILGRIDATVAGLCPCGAEPAPGSAWCSPDCRPTHEGPDTFGSDAMRWSPEAPPAGFSGWCSCGCGLPLAELMGWELVEPVVEEGSRVGVMRAGRGAGPSMVIEDETEVGSYHNPLVRQVSPAAADGVLSILAGEPLEHWEARQVRDDRLVEGYEALLGQRLPEWMRWVLNGWPRRE